MVCKLCGHSNLATNKFCGECGALLVPKPQSSTAEPLPPRPDYEPKAEHFASILEPVDSPVVTEPAEPSSPWNRESVVREPVLVEAKSSRSVDRTPLGFEPEGKHYTTISGPSFLGLTDDSPSEDDSADYLLEDEEPSGGRAGWYVFSLVAVAILATVGVLEWRAIKTGKLSIPFFSSSTAESPKTADQPTTGSSPAATSPSPADTPSNPATSAANPSSGQTGADDTKPDQLTTDHSNAPAESKPPEDGSSSSAQPDQTADAEEQPATGTSESESTPSKAAPDKSTPEKIVEKSAAAASVSPREEKASKPKATRPEKIEEKPDPKTNRMLIAGEKYLYGRGVRRDCNQALIYFRAAASEDNGPAMSHLGAMYASGNCVRIDRATAYSWFVRAQEADPGNEWISRNLNMLWRDMSSQERAAVSR